ncbi:MULTISPECIES: glycoside hydrolase family 99-like domain-containing protein [unclassified Clostridioides]|uniref:glycoside hydrolase family 99-like domain-containing protein n=1 Tax=unclassified Clostridioides TaxID=2635829 RepID=UPI001D100703|nr:glycoside hydrolase family 99-like domain-containing protein [Clostridioides sp. ZZV15-6598]MCC0729888.1 glycoside hydrolase family 99-like domain-containing protein [Clostridioides sp. ZZV14-6048]MCC0734770.1 glycoside hydrolase family 99-like domain-containing protein [Clostridioides sp. ZZV14-6009]
MNYNMSLDNNMINIISEYEYNNDKVNTNFTSIIISVHNHIEYTKLCIESIRKFTSIGTFEIIVIDNASTDGTIKWLKSQNDLKIIQNKDYPTEMFTGYIRGIEASKGESILFLENKIVATPNWLDNLSKALYSDNNIGIVCAVSNEDSICKNMNLKYDNILDMLDFSKCFNVSNSKLWDYKFSLSTSCFLIKKEVLNQIGDLDKLFTLEHYIFQDVFLRVIDKGYNLLMCKDTFVHCFNKILHDRDDELKYIKEINNEKLNSKWNFYMKNSSKNYSEIMQMIKSRKKESINVLEIGYGLGEALLELKNIYRNANTYRTKININSGELGEIVFNNLMRNTEGINLKSMYGFFDYIIFPNTLNCLRNPWDVLRNIYEYLKEDGYILVSVPNIMHISVIKKLINGSFSYSDSEVLDKSYLRFFTFKEIHKLFKETGYEIVEIYYSKTDMESEELQLIENLSGLLTKDIKEEYFVDKYFLKISKKNKKCLENDINKYKMYIDYIHNKNSFSSEYSKDISLDYEFNKIDSKLIAYYLPQFHLDDNNNEWWGRGSTEWDNVSRAIPQYIGHYQPRLPKDLGFYSLESIDTFKRQIQLAKGSGIYGFSIYYYLSGDVKLLRKPLDILLNNKDLKIPFCLYWANEDWTRGYKSDNKEILVKQLDTKEDYKNAIYDMKRYLEDDRYIEINNKKVIMIYRPLNIPDPIEVIGFWREYCKLNNIGDIYVIATKEPWGKDSSYYHQCGFDAVNEFSPHGNISTDLSKYSIINKEIDFIKDNYEGRVFDYREYVEKRNYIDYECNKIYKCVTPSWDNTPRKAEKSWIFEGSSPKYYYMWLKDIMTMNKKNRNLDEDIVFINAWNEWGEGAILEPCSKYGYAYLNLTQKAIKDVRREFFKYE